MCFIYAIPKHAGPVTRATFKALGLDYALSEGNPDYLPVPSGPSGLPCVVAMPQPPAGVGQPPVAYQPDDQVWTEGPKDEAGACAYHIGYWKTAKPTPAHLARKRQVDGEMIAFDDASQWLIPVARSNVKGRFSTLPTAIVLGTDGKMWQRRPLEKYLSLCVDAEMVWDTLLGVEPEDEAERADDTDPDGEAETEKPKKPGINLQESMRIAIAALQVNYRVGPHELSLLEPTDTDLRTVLHALVDFPAFVRMAVARQKKD